jgi:hypothetical protein
MAKIWSDFYNYVLPELPSCGQDLVTLAIQDVCLDFFDNAGIYTVTATPITAIAGTALYNLGPPTNWDVAWVRAAWFNGNEITPTNEDALNKKYQNWSTQTGTPTEYMLEDQNTIRLVPMPDSNAGGLSLTMRQVLKPQRSATGFSTDWVYDRWLPVLAAGVKAKLMAMPTKAWSNPGMAKYYGDMYEGGKGDAIRDSSRSLTRSQRVVKMNPAA